jgi:hypothetical protein
MVHAVALSVPSCTENGFGNPASTMPLALSVESLCVQIECEAGKQRGRLAGCVLIDENITAGLLHKAAQGQRPGELPNAEGDALAVAERESVEAALHAVTVGILRVDRE